MTTAASPVLLAPDKLRLDLAWRRVNSDAQDDLVPDPLGYKDVKQRKSAILQQCRDRVARQEWANAALTVDVPKAGYTLRPAMYLTIGDRLIYHALVQTFAHSLTGQLVPDGVSFASRPTPNATDGTLLIDNRQQWTRWRQTARKRRKATSADWLLVTDLTAFFEHIDLSLLQDCLAALAVREAVRNPLFNLLESWCGPRKHGLPQSQDPSSFLSNLYLESVDRAMLASGFDYLRFSDDILVFAPTKAGLKRALATLCRALRDKGLFIQSGKTRMLHGEEIDSYLNRRQDKIEAAKYDLDIGSPLGPEKLRGLWKEILSDTRPDEHHLKFCIYRFKKTRDPHIIKDCMRLLSDLPNLSNTLCEYLSIFVRRPSVRSGLMRHLSDRELNLYDWQEMHILRCLRESKSVRPDLIAYCFGKCTSPGTHWAVRSAALHLLAEFSLPSQLRKLEADLPPLTTEPEQRVAAFHGLRLRVPSPVAK